jgi:predicted porin
MLASPGVAQSAFFGLDASYRTETVKTTTKAETTETGYALSLGYRFGSGLALGLRYDGIDIEGDAATDEIKVSDYGVGAAFMHTSGFVAGVYYLHNPTRTYSDRNVEYTASGGSGTLLEVGYLAPVGGFGVGGKLVQHTRSYTKVESRGETTDLPYELEVTGLWPWLGVVFFF